jgi:hypothetical protein
MNQEEVERIYAEAGRAISPNKYGKIQGDYLPSAFEHFELAKMLLAALDERDALLKRVEEAEHVAERETEIAMAHEAEIGWLRPERDALREALLEIPRILYGLGLEDPRQALVAQRAIDLARSASKPQGSRPKTVPGKPGVERWPDISKERGERPA